MADRTIVYLAVPRITRSFAVEVKSEDAGSGELVGDEISAVAEFLRISSGIPRFDLESDGRVFRECRLSTMPSAGSVLFTFERVRAADEEAHRIAQTHRRWRHEQSPHALRAVRKPSGARNGGGAWSLL